MARNVFISYSRHDDARVTVLATDIESLGHKVWLDRALTGGQRWWDQILNNVRECDVFVVAVSRSALDSRACLDEFTYAMALGKPILPIEIQRDFADSLMPPNLGDLQRVDYSQGDKMAFASLNRALASLPAPGPMPDIAPPRPAVPASYLFDLKTEIGAPGAMPPATQEHLLKQLEASLSEGHAKADVLSLVRSFRGRDDVLVRMDRSLAELETRLAQGSKTQLMDPELPRDPERPALPPLQSREPPAPRQPVQRHEPAPQPEPVRPPEQAQGHVNPAWWLAPVFFALVGGAIAYYANRNVNPKTAKQMLIFGVIMIFVWAAVFSEA